MPMELEPPMSLKKPMELKPPMKLEQPTELPVLTRFESAIPELVEPALVEPEAVEPAKLAVRRSASVASVPWADLVTAAYPEYRIPQVYMRFAV